MLVKTKEILEKYMLEQEIVIENAILPNAELDTEHIQAIMINEGPPEMAEDYFYSTSTNPSDMQTTEMLFERAGVQVKSIQDILNKGIYITTAIKSPKSESSVSTTMIRDHLPLLEKELDMFPNLKVVMLMGDVARKALNMLAKKRQKKNAIPAGSTYKIRAEEFYYQDMRLFPSYIMTGKNLLIEKSKQTMAAEDIKRMMDILGCK